MLRGEGLAFRYDKKLPWVLDNISLDLNPGEVVGLSGPSGRGKTTLARLLAGYLTPGRGRVTLHGGPLPARGYCPVQLIFQHPELAVNPRWRIARVLAEGVPPTDDLIDAVGFDRAWLDRYPHELSGGELQRVAVARVLNSQTRYLIADEMTAMLDANTQAQIWQAVMTFARSHAIGVLVISHHQPLLDRLCDRIVPMPDPAGRPDEDTARPAAPVLGP